MTNRDAINILEEVKILDDTMYAYNPSYLEALDMALTALEAEETWYATHEYPPKTRWIPCQERMPECEQEVLICTMKKVYVSRKTGMEWYEEPIITPALYEDGTMLEVNSKWRWEDIDYAGWDEEEDCGIIPEGWWENRHFNPDDVYNNVVDKKVIAWMPLPSPYKAERQEE